MAGKIACQISCTLNGIQQYAYLDSINDTTVNTSSTLTTSPLVTGDMLSDHMFRNQASFTVSGRYGTNGSFLFNTEGVGSKLANFQSFFEKIKDEGALCNIVKINYGGAKTAQFMPRNNMALTAISWTEGTNYLDFTFTFTQVLTSAVKLFSASIEDPYLPNVVELSAGNFMDAALDWSYVDAAVIEKLRDDGMITEEFLNHISSLSNTAIASILVGVLGIAYSSAVATGTTVATALSIGASTGSIAGPVGTLVGVVAGLFILGVISLINDSNKQRNYKFQQFKYYINDSEKQKQEDARFCKFIGEIHTNLERLNNLIQIYRIAQDGEQENILVFDDDYYLFQWNKISSGMIDYDLNDYRLTFKNFDGEIMKTVSSVYSAAVNNYFQCNDSNALYHRDRTWVHLMRSDSDLSNYASLRSFYIAVSHVDPQSVKNMIDDIINEALYLQIKHI